MHDLVISLHQQMKCCSGCSLASFLWHILYIVVYFSYKNLKDLNPSFILLHRCCQIINKITHNLNIQWESLIMPCRCKVSVNVLYNLHSLLANWVFSAHCTDLLVTAEAFPYFPPWIFQYGLNHSSVGFMFSCGYASQNWTRFKQIIM